MVGRDEAEYEKRALAEGSDATGGFLTPEVLSGPMIDKLRNATRVVQAGATIVPVDSDNHSLPRLATDPTPGWKSEGSAVALSDPAFERVTFQVKTLACLTKLSFELFEDMTPASAGIIEKSLVASLALELDRVGLRGSGSDPEPKGVLNQSGVTAQTNGTNGGAATWTMLTTAVAALQARNVEPTAAIANPRYEKSLALLADTTGQPLRPAPYIADLPRLTTNQIPINLTTGSSSDTSEIYVGNWADLFIGVRPSIGVRIQRLNEAYADHMQIGVLAWLRADIQLAHAASFQVVTGVRP
jgi:HK97 family phage major capsid protein